MSQISSQLTIEEIQKNYKIYLTGWLTKRGKIQKNWKKRFFVLFSHEDKFYICYFVHQTLDSKSIGRIDLISPFKTSDNIEIIEIASRGDMECLRTPSMKLRTPNRDYFMFGKDVDVWIKTINTLLVKTPPIKARFSSHPLQIQRAMNQIEQCQQRMDSYIYRHAGIDDGKLLDQIIKETDQSIEQLKYALETFDPSENNFSKENKQQENNTTVIIEPQKRVLRKHVTPKPKEPLKLKVVKRKVPKG